MGQFFSTDDYQGTVGKKMRDLLESASKKRHADKEHNIRPKRKARKDPVVEDSEIDDSDTDSHFKLSGNESSSSDDASLSDNNNKPVEPAKSSRKL